MKKIDELAVATIRSLCIDEINKAMLMIENDIDLYEAEEQLEKYRDAAKYVVYDSNKKGFYIQERRFDFDEIRLRKTQI